MANLIEWKIEILISLCRKGRIVLEEIKLPEYKAEVRERLGL